MVVAFKVLKTAAAAQLEKVDTRMRGKEEEEEEGLLAVQNLIFPSSSPSSFRRSRKPPGPIKKEAPSPPGGGRGGKGRRQNPVPKSIYGRKFSFLSPLPPRSLWSEGGKNQSFASSFLSSFPLLSSAATPPPFFLPHIFWAVVLGRAGFLSLGRLREEEKKGGLLKGFFFSLFFFFLFHDLFILLLS